MAVTVLVGIAASGSAAAAQPEPIYVDVASFKTDYTKFEAIDDARLGIIIHLVGAGVVDCLDNVACRDSGLDRRRWEVQQSMAATLDTGTGRVRGQIVIDVISAGSVGAGSILIFSGSGSGSVAGTLTPGADAAQWDLVLTARARADGGAKAQFEMQGLLERSETGSRIRDLRGTGVLTQTYYDESPIR